MRAPVVVVGLAPLFLGLLGCSSSGDSAAQPGDDSGTADGTAVDSSGDAAPDAASSLDASSDGSPARDSASGDAGGCATFTPDPGLAAKRAACTFAAGDKVGKTLDDATAARAA